MTIIRRAGPALALLAVLAPPPARAQGTPAQGTAAQRQACMPDAFRLCRSEIPDVSAVTACMRREESRLSPACRSAMAEAPAPGLAAARSPAGAGALLGMLGPLMQQGGRGRRTRDTRRLGRGMREAQVWIDRLGGTAGLATLMGGVMGGMTGGMQGSGFPGGGPLSGSPLGGGLGGIDAGALAGLREMRVGDIMDMMR